MTDKMVDNKKNTSWLFEKPIIHRGVYAAEVPEHVKDAFSYCAVHALPMEVDLLEIEDEIIVWRNGAVHNESGRKYSELTFMEIKDYFKENGIGTDQILSLKEFLNLIDDRVPVLIEPKSNILQESADLINYAVRIADVLDKYNGKFAIHSANPFLLKTLSGLLESKIPIGQISWSFANVEIPDWYRELHQSFGFCDIHMPDFMSYRVIDIVGNASDRLDFLRSEYDIKVLGWTVKNREDEKIARSRCDNIIIEGSTGY